MSDVMRPLVLVTAVGTVAAFVASLFSTGNKRAGYRAVAGLGVATTTMLLKVSERERTAR